MEPRSSRGPATAGIRVIVAEAAWRRAVKGAAGIAARAAAAAGAEIAVTAAMAEAARQVMRSRVRSAGRTSAATGTPGCTAAGGAVPAGTVVLAADRTVRRLNARHRGLDKPTNVLTYPPSGPGQDGEIVLALGVIRREAAAARRRPAHHLAHLVVHGMLHLAGHDHHHPGAARRMELAEARILHRLGVPNPWKPPPAPHHPRPSRPGPSGLTQTGSGTGP